ncbi:MAG: lipid II flippase MurJ [Patescibacteria group bacterium]
MVNRIVSFIQREISGLHEAAYLLGLAAIASQILALVRDRLLAHGFGAGTELDLYYAAFRIPDFLFVTIASLVSASVLIPFLSQKFAMGEAVVAGGGESGGARATNSHSEGKKFFDVIFTVFFVAIIFVAAIVFIFAPAIVPLVLPGFRDPETLQTLVALTRILLLSPIFLGFSNLFASITQLRSRFFIYALSPLVYNLGIIFGALFLVPRFGLHGLVAGVVLGAFAHMAVQVPFIASEGMFPVFARVREWPVAFAAMALSVPRTLAISATEISKFFLISTASLMAAGSISVFNFAWNLQSVPLSIIGVSYSMAAFPTLTKYISSGEHHKYVEHVITATRHIIFLCLPVAAIFIVLRAQIVRVILGSGEFSWSDTRLTAAMLAIFMLSLVSQSLVLLFTRARYSSSNTKTPVFINIFTAVLTIVLALVLLHIYKVVPAFHDFLAQLLRVGDVADTSVLVLPLAFSIGVTIAAIIHIFSFHREFKTYSAPLEKSNLHQVGQTFFESLMASLVMAVSAYVTLNILDDVFSIDTFVGIFFQGFFAGLVGLVLSIILLVLIKNREAAEIWQTLHRKFWRAPVVGPDVESVI